MASRHPDIPRQLPMVSFMGGGGGLGGKAETAKGIAEYAYKAKGRDKLKEMCRRQGASRQTCDGVMAAADAFQAGDYEAAAQQLFVGGVAVMCTAAGSPALGTACKYGAQFFTGWLASKTAQKPLDPFRVAFYLPGGFEPGGVEGQYLGGYARSYLAPGEVGYGKDYRTGFESDDEMAQTFALETVGMREVQRKEDLKPGEGWQEHGRVAWPMQAFFPDVGKSYRLTAELANWIGWYRDWDGKLKHRRAFVQYCFPEEGDCERRKRDWAEYNRTHPDKSPTVVEVVSKGDPRRAWIEESRRMRSYVAWLQFGAVYVGPGWADMLAFLERYAPKKTPTVMINIPAAQLVTGPSGPELHDVTIDVPQGTVAVKDPDSGSYYLIAPPA